LWKRQYLQRLGQNLPVRTIVDPATGNVFAFETPYTQDKLERWIKEGRIIFPTDPSKYPARKEFLAEYENKQQLVTALGLYATKSTTEQLYGLFNGEKIFTNPKPHTLIQFLIQQCSSNADIVLDFFSGSATTAHAVMQLNAEDGGNRKFIMVQLPEETDEKSEAYKAGYKTIPEIGKERIRRAGKKIKEEAGLSAQNLDTGFRVLKLDSSNMEDVYYTPQDFDLQTFFAENVKADRTSEDLLFQVMLDLGIELSAKIESKQIAGKEVHFVDDTYLVACFDTDVNETTIKEIAKLQPIYFVMRDASASNDNVIDNFEQIFKHYSPDTNCRII
jgi:adenine-specific DNA-methyltransferase